MRTTTSESTRSLPLVTSRMATPPPTPTLDLHDADAVVGWIDGMTIGFRGFGDETEASHAAWVAYRTMSRRFARESGRRPIPIDTEPLSLARSGDVELILAGGRPIATLVRPGADSRSGPESFGFELQLPVPADELTLRSTAYLVYRTLRRSGIRWAMWAPTPSAAPTASEARAGERAPAAAASARTPPRRGEDAAAAAARPDGVLGVVGTAAIVLAMLAVVALPAITASTVVHLLGGAAAILALVALASLVRLVATDVREALRSRERPTKPERLGALRSRAADRLARRRPRRRLIPHDVIRST